MHESGEEINEENIKSVLEAGGADVSQSKAKAMVAAMEEVDMDTVIEEAMPDPEEPDDEASEDGEESEDSDGMLSGLFS